MGNYPLMKRYRLANVMTFAGGSLPVDALNPQTISELQMIASRKGQTIEQVMSEALDWFLAVPSGVQGQRENSSISRLRTAVPFADKKVSGG